MKQLNAVHKMHLLGTAHIIAGQTIIVPHHLITLILLHGMLDNLLLKSTAMLKCITLSLI